MKDHILVIHRNPHTAETLAQWCHDAGWESTVTGCRESVASLARSTTPVAVLAEATSVEGDPALLAASMRELFPECRVVAILPYATGCPASAHAEGLDDWLSEPLEPARVVTTIRRVLDAPRPVGHRSIERDSSSKWLSPATRVLMDQALRMAEHDGIILLLGESGTGKDHLARWIHLQSARRHGPFFTVNCAALSRELAESELFGHESGAFTGTKGRKRGLLELAERGTLLLDEVGELEPSVQAKLLTFLDSRSFVRVGGERHVSVSARLLAATNRDLLHEVERGVFRRDLYYRLAVAPLYVPPLRERREDLPELIVELLTILRQDLALEHRPVIDDGALGVLLAYDWPGNIRELRNVLERACMLAAEGRIRVRDLALPASHVDWHITVRFPETGVNLHDLTRDVARRVVAEALRRASSKQEAARLLGISRHALAHQLRILGLANSISGIVQFTDTALSSQQRAG